MHEWLFLVTVMYESVFTNYKIDYHQTKSTIRIGLGPNKSASAQYDNTRGAWLTQESEGCTLTERKEGRIGPTLILPGLN